MIHFTVNLIIYKKHLLLVFQPVSSFSQHTDLVHRDCTRLIPTESMQCEHDIIIRDFN